MEGNEGVSLLKHVMQDAYFFVIVGLVISISVSLIIIVNAFSSLAVLLSFLAGCVGMHFLMRKRSCLPNFISSFKRQEKGSVGSKLRTVCSRCGVIECRRHCPELNIYTSKPWMNLKVPKEVDQAFKEILDLVIDKHIYPWYSTISKDDDFVQEIRTSLRFLFSSLLRRALQVDLVTLITDKAGGTLCKHLDACLQVPVRTQEGVLHALGEHLHPALESREKELSYVRALTSRILPFILPHKYMGCSSAISLVREIFSGLVFLPLMDVIADPDVINHLLILFFDKTPMSELPDSTLPKVEFLSEFVASHVTNKRPVLSVDFKTILEDQRLLYVFMQFLKEESSLNILQFHLSIDEFNARILNPDLNQDELEVLHLQAQQMYNTYFAPHALDRINFDDDIVHQIRDIIAGPPENVVKLQTTTPLFRAYDHAYRLLENTYCPMFLQSEKYFSLLCGERSSGSNVKGAGKGSKKGSTSPSTMSKLGNKLKGVFTAHVDDGQICEEESGIDLAEALFPDSASGCGLDEGYTMEDDPRLKKLSAWRVSIPQVLVRMDATCKYYHTFCINVQRIDVTQQNIPDELHWTLERRYNEFYVLEAKLTEFHGELSIQLPAKRSQQQKGFAYLESKRPEFERYLQTLLTLPALQGSELLFQFLKSPVPFTSSFLPDIRLGKMIKTVPMKLMKERGQHLFPFLQSFIASTEPAKPKPSKDILKDMYDTTSTDIKAKLTSGIFQDNFSSVKNKAIHSPASTIHSVVDLREIYDYILYIATNVVHVPDCMSRLLGTCDVLLRNTLQAGVEWYLEVKLNQAFKPQRLEEILHLLRDVLFFDDDPPRTLRERAERARLALLQTKEFFPRFMRTENFEDGLTLMHDFLQKPLLNKQISYVLLDILAVELFPELLEMNRTDSIF